MKDEGLIGVRWRVVHGSFGVRSGVVDGSNGIFFGVKVFVLCGSPGSFRFFRVLARRTAVVESVAHDLFLACPVGAGWLCYWFY